MVYKVANLITALVATLYTFWGLTKTLLHHINAVTHTVKSPYIG